MKRFLIFVALVLCATSPCFAQALHGHASNVLLQAPNTFFCAPPSEDGVGSTVACNTGSGTVVQSSTTFTSLTAIVGVPVTGSHVIVLQLEDFTTGNNIGTSCSISGGQASCSVTFSTTVPAGHVLAIKVWDDLSGTTGYNVRSLDWVLQ